MFHILLSCDSQGSGMYICMYNNCDVRPHKKTQQKYHMLTFHYIILAIYLVYGHDDQLIQSNTHGQSLQMRIYVVFWLMLHLSFSTTPLIVVRMQQGWNALQLWQWVVNFTTRPFYCQGWSQQYQMYSWMDGSQRQSGHFGEELNLLSLQGFES